MKTTSTTTEPRSRLSAKEASLFLATYADRLFSSGSTVIRLEKNVKRIAASLGMEADISILPHYIYLTVRDEGNRYSHTTAISIRGGGISFNINTALSRLSWDMADHKLDFEQARIALTHIATHTGALNSWLLAVLVGLANAAFCRLFGGDFVAMGIIFVSTFAGYLIKQLLMERKVDYRLVVMLCSFVSSVLSSADGLFHLGTTPGQTIATSVLYLVPGIPFINSFCDMIDRHYICAFSRLTDAIVITCCMSAGLLGGMLLMHEGMF